MTNVYNKSTDIMYCLHPRADESIKRVVSTPSWMEKPPAGAFLHRFFQSGNWDFEMQNKWQSTQTPYLCLEQTKAGRGEIPALFSLGGKNTAKILAKIPHFNG